MRHSNGIKYWVAVTAMVLFAGKAWAGPQAFGLDEQFRAAFGDGESAAPAAAPAPAPVVPAVPVKKNPVPATQPSEGVVTAPPVKPSPVSRGGSKKIVYERPKKGPTILTYEGGISFMPGLITMESSVSTASPGTTIDETMLGLPDGMLLFEPELRVVIMNTYIVGGSFALFPSLSGDSIPTNNLVIGNRTFLAATPINTELSFSQLDLDFAYRIMQPRGEISFGLSLLGFNVKQTISDGVQKIITEIGSNGELVPALLVEGTYNFYGMPGHEWQFDGRFQITAGDTTFINGEIGFNYRVSNQFNFGFGYRFISFDYSGTGNNNEDISMKLLMHGPQASLNFGF